MQAAGHDGIDRHRHDGGDGGRPHPAGHPPGPADDRADGEADEGEPRQRPLVGRGGPAEHGQERERPPHGGGPSGGSSSGTARPRRDTTRSATAEIAVVDRARARPGSGAPPRRRVHRPARPRRTRPRCRPACSCRAAQSSPSIASPIEPHAPLTAGARGATHGSERVHQDGAAQRGEQAGQVGACARRSSQAGFRRCPVRGDACLEVGVAGRDHGGDVGDRRGVHATPAAPPTADFPERVPPRTRVINAPSSPTAGAAWTARATGAPYAERGPPNGSGHPTPRQRTVTASDAVPVPATPASSSACTLASVTVQRRLASGAPRSAGPGRTATTLTVPGARLRAQALFCSGAAAQTGRVRPTVASTRTPASSAAATAATSAAVSIPTPGAGRGRARRPPRPRGAGRSRRP